MFIQFWYIMHQISFDNSHDEILLTFETASDLVLGGLRNLKISQTAFPSLTDFVLVGKRTSSSGFKINFPFYNCEHRFCWHQPYHQLHDQQRLVIRKLKII